MLLLLFFFLLFSYDSFSHFSFFYLSSLFHHSFTLLTSPPPLSFFIILLSFYFYISLSSFPASFPFFPPSFFLSLPQLSLTTLLLRVSGSFFHILLFYLFLDHLFSLTFLLFLRYVFLSFPFLNYLNCALHRSSKKFRGSVSLSCPPFLPSETQLLPCFAPPIQTRRKALTLAPAFCNGIATQTDVYSDPFKKIREKGRSLQDLPRAT